MKFFTSMKFALAALLLAWGSTAMADEITFNFSDASYPKSDNSGSTAGDNPTLTSGVVTMEVTTKEGATTTRIWSDGTLRVYKGSTVTLKSSGEPITQIIWTAKTPANNHLTAEGALADGKTLTWTGSAQEVVFTNDELGNSQYTQVVITVGGETPPPPTPVDKIYEKTLISDEGGFIPNNVTLPQDLSYIWNNGSYGWVASAFKSETAYAAESWLVSPKFDVEAGSAVTLSFDHALNKGTNDAISLMVSEDKTNWTAVEIPNVPDGTNWTFIGSGDIDLSSFAGKTLYIAFKYASTAENAPTWEIQNFLLKGKGTATSEKVYTTYESLTAIKGAATAEKAGAILQLNNLLVTYVNGQYVYVTDGKEGFLLFGKTSLKAGDIISGTATGELYLYHALPELALEAVDGITVVSSDNEVVASVEEVGDVQGAGLAYSSKLVKFEEVYFDGTALTDKAVTFSQDGNTLTLYDQFGLLSSTEFVADKAYSFTAIISLRDETVQAYPISKSEFDADYTFVGDGTKENPYTVTDVLHAYNPDGASDIVWVKGVIVGAANGTMAKVYPFTEGVEATDTNILIADAASENNVGKCVPVELKNKTPFREKLNVKDHPENIGKEVLVQGIITKYFNVAGVKTLGEAIFEGHSVGIDAVNNDAVRVQGIYTLAGQRVETVTRGGLYIIGGKKVLVK